MKSDGLTAIADGIETLPVQLTAEQAQMARDGIREALRRSTPKSYTHHAMARVVEALAPKLSDEAKADMLGLVRSGLAAVGDGRVVILWARAYEALLPQSPANGYVGSIVDVLKYPTTAIKQRTPSEEEQKRNPGEPLSATEYFQKRISGRFPDAKQLQSGRLADLLDWIAKNYSEINLVRPPIRPDLSYVGSGQ